MAKVFTITEGLENMGALRTGGQGSVYKGKRMGPIITAVKLLPTPIHTENANDKHFKDFRNEVEKLKKVNEKPCPNVVKILNSGLTESGSLPFIEMEYIEGPDLEDLLQPPHNPVFTIRETVKLARQLANALAHCHKAGVKHGDIKSNNVKFNIDTGNYVLLDFGLAVMSDEERRSSLRNAGAVEFMAPEQYNGQMLFQSDIYSYGIILYELLAGTVPFPLVNKNETSRNSVMLAHIEKEVPDLLQLRKSRIPAEWSAKKAHHEMQVPPRLLEIISTCLEKKPEKRFENGMQLHEFIYNYTETAGSSVEINSVITSLKDENERLTGLLRKYKQVKKLKWAIFAAATVLLCLSVFGINSIFVKKENIKTDSTRVVSEAGPSPKVVKDTSASALTDTAKSKIKQADSIQRTDSRKKKKTKDGLVDDVPYF